MTNLYKLTKDNNLLLFIGTIHNQNFTQFPLKWKNMLVEYNPIRLLMELGDQVITTTEEKLPGKEYLESLGFAIESHEEPSINKLQNFEKIFILSHSLQNHDKKNINQKMAIAWQNHLNTPTNITNSSITLDKQALEFEELLKQEVGEELFSERLTFFKLLNDKGLDYSWQNLLTSCELTYEQMDNMIKGWYKTQIPNLIINGLESEEDRDTASSIQYNTQNSEGAFIKNMTLATEQLLACKEEFTTCMIYSSEEINYIENIKSANIRNSAWLPQILSFIDSGDKVLICVGDYHFLGKNGILYHFEDLGYKIRILDENGNSYGFDALTGNTIWSSIELNNDHIASSAEADFQDINNAAVDVNTTILGLNSLSISEFDISDHSK